MGVTFPCSIALLHVLVLLVLLAQCSAGTAPSSLRGASPVGQDVPGVLLPRARRSNTSKLFAWLTDAHVDPYYGSGMQECKKNVSVTGSHAFGMLGCDSPYLLLEATAAAASAAAAAVGGAEFVVYTGDFVRHDQDKMPDPYRNVTDIIANVTRVLGSHFPTALATGTLSVGILGNDDSPINYELNITTSDPSSPWLANVENAFTWAGAAPPGDYSYGGFWETELGGITILSINTIMYSMKHTPKPGDGQSLPEDPFGQFLWLRQRLAAAATEQRSVWVMGHIPPGIESYGHTELWHAQYVMAYLDIVQNATLGPFIAAQLFAHVHADELRLLPQAPEGTGPMLLSGAVSPIYSNNPAFRLVEYEPSTGKMLDYSVYYAEIMNKTDEGAELTWRFGYSATGAYPPLQNAVESVGFLNMAAFAELATELGKGGSLWNTYASWYKTQIANNIEACGSQPLVGNAPTDTIKNNCGAAYMCALTVFTQETYDACVHSGAYYSISHMVLTLFASLLALAPAL